MVSSTRNLRVSIAHRTAVWRAPRRVNILDGTSTGIAYIPRQRYSARSESFPHALMSVDCIGAIQRYAPGLVSTNGDGHSSTTFWCLR